MTYPLCMWATAWIQWNWRNLIWSKNIYLSILIDTHKTSKRMNGKEKTRGSITNYLYMHIDNGFTSRIYVNNTICYLLPFDGVILAFAWMACSMIVWASNKKKKNWSTRKLCVAGEKWAFDISYEIDFGGISVDSTYLRHVSNRGGERERKGFPRLYAVIWFESSRSFLCIFLAFCPYSFYILVIE